MAHDESASPDWHVRDQAGVTGYLAALALLVATETVGTWVAPDGAGSRRKFDACFKRIHPSHVGLLAPAPGAPKSEPFRHLRCGFAHASVPPERVRLFFGGPTEMPPVSLEEIDGTWRYVVLMDTYLRGLVAVLSDVCRRGPGVHGELNALALLLGSPTTPDVG